MKLKLPLQSSRPGYFGFFLSILFVLGTTLGAHAVESATATISSTPDGANFDYTLTLKDTGTTTIGTFWFSWIPGQDYMNSAPITTTPPAGWTVGQITHAGASDGYAIQWIASSAASDLAAGSSLTFSFESAVTPAQMAGDSPFFPTTPEGTSFIYSGVPFSDAGVRIVVASVPEPSSIVLTFVGALGIGFLRWRRAQARA